MMEERAGKVVLVRQTTQRTHLPGLLGGRGKAYAVASAPSYSLLQARGAKGSSLLHVPCWTCPGTMRTVSRLLGC